MKGGQKAFPEFGFKITIENYCLGGFFIGEDSALDEWILAKPKFWEETVAYLVSAAPNFLQIA
jgi:hypothetical protein